MPSPQLIDQSLLDTLSGAAAALPRRRKNLNFHPDEHSACHRLLNALEPGTYIPPHRHLDPNKEETMLMLRGRIGVLWFDDAGTIIRQQIMEANGAVVGVNIGVGQYHSLVALAAGSVFFEGKHGPYLPLTEAERAPWAPAEQTPAASAYLAQLQACFDTDQPA